MNHKDLILSEILKLHGCEEFKTLCRQLSRAGAEMAKPPVLLLSTDDGCGITTVFCRYARLTQAIFGGGQDILMRETVLTKGNERFDNAGDSISFMADIYSSVAGRVALLFDLEDFMGNKLSDPYLDKFLKKLKKHSRRSVIVFRIPYLEQEKYEETLEKLSAYCFIKPVRIAPPTDGELAEHMAARLCSDMGTDAKGFSKYFIRLLEAKRERGRFFYFKTADIVYSDLLFTRELMLLQKPDITIPEVCKKLYSYYHESGVQDPVEELTSLIGLSEIKQKIEEITANILYMKKRDGEKKPNIHMLFTGPPGTGKTVVARLVGKIFKEKGIIPIGDLIEVTRKDLVGEYIGQTAIKTAEVVKSAIGSVLFIDEAYALTNETVERKDLGFEAVAQLISDMETHTGEFSVIMAGYEDEIERLFELNVGLRDRFAYKISFKAYSRNELYEIFIYQTKNSNNFQEGLLEAAKGFFNGLSDEFINDYSFANARFVRNIVERMISKALQRHADDELSLSDGRITLCAEDFNRAISSKDITELLNSKTRRKIGFGRERFGG